jgi:hypothetical protein
VAVVRVEVCGVDDAELLIELLAVGRDPHGDTLLGRTTSATAACDLLDHWLGVLANGTGERAAGVPDGAETEG